MLNCAAWFALQDPEGILAAPQGGHIQRRSFEKQLAQDKALARQVEREREQARAQLEAERAVNGPFQLIYYTTLIPNASQWIQ